MNGIAFRNPEVNFGSHISFVEMISKHFVFSKVALVLGVISGLACLQVLAQDKEEVYRFSADIERRLEKDTVPWKYQIGATEYSFGGFYQRALETWDKNGGGVRPLSREDSIYLKDFRSRPAKDYILERAEKERVIIINEAHHNSRHRVFTASLLEGLYQKGYRFLGLEALDDSLLMKRTFPVLSSGYYTQESQMANLIYEAQKMGFTVFGYEADGNANGKEREIGQARNIARMMAKHPAGKFLIHCGYDHVIEGTPGSKDWEKAMAGRLKEITGVDPFTMDQVACTERANMAWLNPWLALVKPQEEMVLVRADGKLFNGSAKNDQTDGRILHPITKEVNGRPDWLRMQGRRKDFVFPKAEIPSFPALILAYRKGEFEKEGVPADVVELLDAGDVRPLVLTPGTYTLVVKDRQYKVLKTKDIELK